MHAAVTTGSEPPVADASAETSGDSDAILQVLLEEHAPVMYRVARSVVRDAALAEDVVQESLLKAWQAAGSFRGDSLRGWVLRITHNTAISALRKRREDVRDPFTLPETAAPMGPDRAVAGRFMADDLWKALGLLDPDTRTIVVLREVEGMSYEEIAATLSLPLPTVKTRLFRARRTLALALADWR